MTAEFAEFSSIAALQPRTRVPFLDAFRVQHGPAGLLGRFFLSADTRMKERGITLRFITLDDLVDLSEKNSDNWGSTNPMFDPRYSYVPAGSICLAGYDDAGEIKLCICAKPFDARPRSFASIVNAGGFTAVRPDCSRSHIASTIDAPFAYEMFGLLGYVGALWVHPDARGGRFASIMSYIVNACLLTLWNPAYLLGSVQHSTVGSGLYERYGYLHSMASLVVTSNGMPEVDLTIVYMTPNEFLDGLATYLDEIWPKIDAAVAARQRQ